MARGAVTQQWGEVLSQNSEGCCYIPARGAGTQQRGVLAHSSEEYCHTLLFIPTSSLGALIRYRNLPRAYSV